jgi:chitodextrinase
MPNTTNTTYTFTGLNPETEYKVTIKARDTSDNVSMGVTVNASTVANTAPPIVSSVPGAGTYANAQTVTLSSDKTGSTIYYTLNGSMPTEASSVYSTPLVISTPTNIKYFAKDSSGVSGNIKQERYTVGTITDTAAPILQSPNASGTYNATQYITASTNESTIIYYRFTATNSILTASASDTPYTGAIPIASTQRIALVAYDASGNKSSDKTMIFTITQ